MESQFDLLLRGGRVIDPATGRDGVADVGVRDGRIVAIDPALPADKARQVVDVSGKIVTAGLIDTHAHVYQHVTGRFGLNADTVGVRSGVTTLVDQGGPSCMTIPGFRHFVVEKSESRVLCFISAYLVGGLEGHLYPSLYGPDQVDVEGDDTRGACERRHRARCEGACGDWRRVTLGAGGDQARQAHFQRVGRAALHSPADQLLSP